MSDSKKKDHRDLEHVTHEMEGLFESLTGRPGYALVGHGWRPNTDVFESTDQMIILVELAGVHKEEVQLTLKGNILRLTGERRLFADKADMAYRNMEVNFGPFERNLYLHESVDADSIQAHYRDGFLEIKIQKRSKEGGGTRQIQIGSDE